MRFPSLDLLARQALAVLRRFPWTLAVGALAALSAIVGSLSGSDEAWERLAFVAALGLPLTIALTLLGETRGWSNGVRHVVLLGGVLALGAFFLSWPGIERRHDGIRYLQLSAALHLSVAFLPFLEQEVGTERADAIEAELVDPTKQNRLYMGPGLLAGGTLKNGTDNTPEKIGFLVTLPACAEVEE